MIYCCYHQRAPRVHAEFLRPIQAGRAAASQRLAMPGDETGESISSRNRCWCELTALYWIRHNTADAIAGLVHYRRLLNLTGEREQVFVRDETDATAFGYREAQIRQLLQRAEIILPKREPLGREPCGAPRTLYTHYAHFHRKEDLEVTLQVLEELHPDQAATARRIVLETASGHWGNLFITSRPILEAYADWLFAILFAVERRIQPQVEQRDPYQQRVYGFLAERLFNVWLACHPELRILEVPMVRLTENPFVAARDRMRCWKKSVLRLFREKC